MLADKLHHIIFCQPGRIKVNVESVFFQIGLFEYDRLDTGKPFQGFLDLVRSVQSEKIQTLFHVLDMQRDQLAASGRGLFNDLFRRAIAATREDHSATTQGNPNVCARQHDYDSLDK